MPSRRSPAYGQAMTRSSKRRQRTSTEQRDGRRASAAIAQLAKSGASGFSSLQDVVTIGDDGPQQVPADLVGSFSKDSGDVEFQFPKRCRIAGRQPLQRLRLDHLTESVERSSNLRVQVRRGHAG